MANKNEKIKYKLFLVLGIVLAVTLYQGYVNLVEEASIALEIHEILLWVILALVSLIVIVITGIPISVKDNQIFISSFAGTQLVLSVYNIFILFNDEIANSINLDLSTYYFSVFIIIFFIIAIFFTNELRKMRK